MKKTKYILSYGGGVNSSALFFYILEKGLPLDLVIFADTGEELDTTYQAVERLILRCKKDNIPFVTVKSDKGNLYEYYFKHKVIMSMMRRDCTGKFKISPIRKYLRVRYGKLKKFIMYIGITWDEAHRIKKSDVKYITNVYPFVDGHLTRGDNLNIIRENNFYAIKSGCKGCMFNRRSSWVKMLIHDPVEYERHLNLEENNMRFPELLLNGHYSLRDLKKAFLNQKSLNSFSDPDINCDSINGGCFL